MWRPGPPEGPTRPRPKPSPARPSTARPKPRPGQISGNLQIWKSGNSESKKLKILKIRIRSIQNVGKVWISRKKSSWSLLGPFQANFSMGRKKYKKSDSPTHFPWWANGPYSPGLGSLERLTARVTCVASSGECGDTVGDKREKQWSGGSSISRISSGALGHFQAFTASKGLSAVVTISFPLTFPGFAPGKEVELWRTELITEPSSYHPCQIKLDDSLESGNSEIWKSRNLGSKNIPKRKPHSSHTAD